MPVPESDGNFAIHTIPTTLKENKSGNNVKFSQVDSYHEYRSRHKHTPPTKDTTSLGKPKRVVEAVVIEHNEQETSYNSSSDSSTGETSNDDLSLDKMKSKSRKDKFERLSDAERIIIYKVLESKPDKKTKLSKTKHSKCSKKNLNKQEATEAVFEKLNSSRASRQLKNNSFEQLNEGTLHTQNNNTNLTSKVIQLQLLYSFIQYIFVLLQVSTKQ